MKTKMVATKEAYRLMEEADKIKMRKKATVEANSFAFIDDEQKRIKERLRIYSKITDLIDELDSKCQDDSLFISVPRNDAGVNTIASPRASYALAKMDSKNFSKQFVIYCSETMSRLPCFTKETLRNLLRRMMHLLMSQSMIVIFYWLTWTHQFPWTAYAQGKTDFEIFGLPEGVSVREPNQLTIKEDLVTLVRCLMAGQVKIRKKGGGPVFDDVDQENITPIRATRVSPTRWVFQCGSQDSQNDLE